MARGGKRGHKGRGKSYTNPEALERQRVKDEKEREWRKARGEVVTDTSEDEDSSGSGSDSSGSGNDASGSEDGIAFSKEEGGAKAGPTDRAAAKAKKAAEKAERAAKQLPPRDMPPSSSSESDSEDESRKPKGAEGMIQVENPNLVVKKNKKVSQLDKEVGGSKEGSSSSSKKDKAPEKPQLSRREREEIEKQRARALYQKRHAEGKTDEAKADLARLAIIRKQREDAEKKRQEERIAKENAAKEQREDKVGGGRRKK